MIHPESISKMLHVLGIRKDHMTTSQWYTIKNQVTDGYMIVKNTKKSKNFMKIGSKYVTFYIS